MARLALAALAAGAAAQVAHGEIIGPCDVTIEKVNADWYHFTASATSTGWIALASADVNSGRIMSSAGKGIIACDSCGQDPTMFAYTGSNIDTSFVDSGNTVKDISVSSEGETMTLSFMAKSMADQEFGESNYVACATGPMEGARFEYHLTAKDKTTVDFTEFVAPPSTSPTSSPSVNPTRSPSVSPTQAPTTPRVEVSLGGTCTVTATFLDEEDTYQFDVVGSDDCNGGPCNYLAMAVGDSTNFMLSSNEGVVGCTECAAQVRSFTYVQDGNGIVPAALEDAVSNATITSEGGSLTLSFRTKSIGAFDFSETRQIACARGIWENGAFLKHNSKAKGTFDGSVLTASPTAAPTLPTASPTSAPTEPTAEPTASPTDPPSPPPSVPAQKTGTVAIFGGEGALKYSIFASREVELTVSLDEANPELANRGWIGVGIAGANGMLGSRVAIFDETEVGSCILADKTRGCQLSNIATVDNSDFVYENGQKIFTIRSAALEGSPLYTEGNQRFVVAYGRGGFGDKHVQKQIITADISLGGNSPVVSPTPAPISAAAGTSASVLTVALAALARMFW